MVELRSATRRFLRQTTIAAIGLGLAGALVLPEPALARHHAPHRGRARTAHRSFAPVHLHHARLTTNNPPFSAYAVDGNSGRVLYGRDENALRHPASITKVMTLYLLFDQIEKGHLSLDSRLEISPHAAAQAPTKLGLRPGASIRVEDAILAIVTKSANDMAVAIAERIGGDEPSFAQMMTRKAHALGMSRTNFVNASGLPADMQLTTARDLVTLGRAIHDHFPRYFRFFSTPSFRYAGQFMPNHNHLMEQVEGMDGIKTGYTRDSGFNLLSSVNRNGHWLVSVVLGGRTRLGRDRIMADLIASEIDKCATTRTTPMIAENPDLEHVAEAIPVVQHEGDTAPPVEGVDDEASVERRPAAATERDVANAEQPSDAASGESEPAPPPAMRPVPVAEPVQKKAAPVRIATLSPSRARPAYVPAVSQPPERDMTATGSIRPRQARVDGSTSRYSGAATATPSTLKHSPRRERADAREKAKPIKIASLEAPVPAERPGASRGGWIIQIGATPDIAQANSLIARAKGQAHALAGAHAFTEKVQKGKASLYRARFAGLDSGAADAACKSLKHAGIACFAARK